LKIDRRNLGEDNRGGFLSETYIMDLPAFRYHPDPIATGSVERSDAECRCCGQRRGYIYICNSFCEEELDEALCPWCIADGSAAQKFDATFSDGHPLSKAGVPEAVIEEVTCRTPGYISWQQDKWLCCCGDACEFHGRPTREQLAALPGPLEEVASITHWSPEEWAKYVQKYVPGSMSMGIYHFVCRHCGRSKYGVDFD
jgi:uncharacterized protein CbrC (UPF0167 family)